MSSETLFIKCKTCRKTISKEANICPQCGNKQKKNSIIQWIGVSFLVLIIIGVFNSSEKDKQLNAKGATSSVITKVARSSKYALPQDQLKFIKLVEKYADKFNKAKNELQQSSLRDQRRNEISGLFTGYVATSWIGKISSLETNTEGNAMLSIRISPNIEIKTWNNAFSDINTSTLINKNSVLYNSLLELVPSQQVKFSGVFFSSNYDHLEEMSMTIQGSMKNQNFYSNLNLLTL